MAAFLHQIGRFSFRHRIVVTAAWILLLTVVGATSATLAGTMTNAVSIPGTESQQAIDQLEERFPQAAAGATARVVIAAPEGETLTDPANTRAAQAVLAQARDAAGVVDVSDPFASRSLSPDGRIALARATYDVQPFEVTDAQRQELLDAAQPGRDAGLRVEFGGDVIAGAPETEPTEVIGVAVAAVVLAITFGSLLAAGLPLLTALIGVGVGMAGITTASGFLELNANTPVLALMIGLAVGIDYALFIVSRYRHELGNGRTPEQATAHAVGTAGSAVVFAGLTVIIALAGLTVVGIPFLGEMGLAASLTVAVAVLIAVTLLPAVLGFVGHRVLVRRIPGLRTLGQPTGDTMGQRWARFVARHRWPVLLATIGALAVVAIPAASMQLGLPDDSMAAQDSTRHAAYDLVSEGFGEGANGQLTVVVDTANGDTGAVRQAAATIAELDHVTAVTPPRTNPAGDLSVFSVTPETGPSSQATHDLVTAIRDTADGLRESTGAELTVTGQTAMNIDVSQKLSDALLPYLALIVGLAFVLLMLVFRSIAVPVKATLGFLGSVAATFGAVVAVFQWGWLTDLLGVDATGPIMSMLPVLLIGVLFGLAMDYQVFLVTRMREEYVHGSAPTTAMVTGFRHGARVVVAAALIMISVFAGFVLSSETLIQSIGFALAFGVAVDAFVVRMTLVPAVMSLLGRGAWWLPRWLDKVLPTVDVEGEALAEPQAERREPARV
ncbi:MMPL family transporter [Haloechinothrix halophila]|uniref:MMPL family transporter n=1 Tax=Haloechinothrix halophila TaxID=1069073 RepID=UPI0003FE1188|nr:MMPL family transporter [Haloechinothrix halophila]